MSMVTDSHVAGRPFSPFSGQEQNETGLNLNLDIARSLRMRRPIALSAGIVALFILVLFALTRKPVFQATSLIYIQPIASKTATDASAGFYDSSRYDTYIQQQLLTFHRPDVIGRAVDQLPPLIRAKLSPNRAAAISEVQSGLKAERITGAYLIAVTVGGRNSEAVAPIANAVVTAYLENGQQDDLALSHEQTDTLLQDRQRIQQELDRERQEQAGLSNSLGVADTAGDGGNPFDAHLADLRAQLAVARNAHAVAEAQLASVRGKPSQLDAIADSVTRTDAELSALKADLGGRRAALIGEMNGLTPQNPLYQKDQAELEKLNQTTNDITKDVTYKSGQNAKAQFALEAVRTGDVQARLEADLASQTKAATASTPQLQRAQTLAESIKLLQARYADVDNAIHTLMLSQSPAFAAHISLTAMAPTAPLPSRKVPILGLAFPIAIFCGLVTAILAQKLDSRIYIGEDVNRILKFPPMAVLPHLSEVGPAAAREFLFRLVAGLDQAHRVDGVSTIIFTAGSQNSVSDDLASSSARELELLGYRMTTISSAKALSPVESVTKTSSPEWRTRAELARSGDHSALRIRRDTLLDEHLERLKHQVDILIINAQPLRSSAETEFVVRLGDLTVLVVESGKTTRKQLQNCLSLVQRLKARGIAVVITDLKLRHADDDFIESVRFAEEQRPSSSANIPEEMLTA